MELIELIWYIIVLKINYKKIMFLYSDVSKTMIIFNGQRLFAVL